MAETEVLYRVSNVFSTDCRLNSVALNIDLRMEKPASDSLIYETIEIYCSKIL
jgi:hypothetical protein